MDAPSTPIFVESLQALQYLSLYCLFLSRSVLTTFSFSVLAKKLHTVLYSAPSHRHLAYIKTLHATSTSFVSQFLLFQLCCGKYCVFLSRAAYAITPPCGDTEICLSCHHIYIPLLLYAIWRDTDRQPYLTISLSTYIFKRQPRVIVQPSTQSLDSIRSDPSSLIYSANIGEPALAPKFNIPYLAARAMSFITGIAHVNLTVPPGTLDQAAEFYGGTLGLTQAPVPEAQKHRLAW